MITLVVFSKDRALQCDSLLRSVKDKCTGIDRVVVLAKASSELHVETYKRLREEGEYDELTVNDAVGGLPLGEDVFQAINDSEYAAFAVDDQLFYRPSDFALATKILDAAKAFVWSWRLGRKDLATREFLVGSEGVDSDIRQVHAPYWACSPLVGDPDYRYLFHTDGSIYRTADWLSLLDKHLPDWRTGKYIPNDFEAAVAARRSEWAPTVGYHLGPIDQTCITWQLNRVQSHYGSPASNAVETSVDALAKAYLAGKRVDNEKLYADTSWTTRFNPPGVRPTHVWACKEASQFYAGLIR